MPEKSQRFLACPVSMFRIKMIGEKGQLANVNLENGC